MRRSYTELARFPTIRARFEYLSLQGEVAAETFGSRRHLNQGFYRSKVWRDLRQYIIFRDGGCDLGVPGYDIYEHAVIHHINPLTVEQILSNDHALTDPENLITCTHDTHNAIHYGDASLLPQDFVERRPGDTKEW